jgi:hypothetical protein
LMMWRHVSKNHLKNLPRQQKPPQETVERVNQTVSIVHMGVQYPVL